MYSIYNKDSEIGLLFHTRIFDVCVDYVYICTIFYKRRIENYSSYLRTDVLRIWIISKYWKIMAFENVEAEQNRPTLKLRTIYLSNNHTDQKHNISLIYSLLDEKIQIWNWFECKYCVLYNSTCTYLMWFFKLSGNLNTRLQYWHCCWGFFSHK